MESIRILITLKLLMNRINGIFSVFIIFYYIIILLYGVKFWRHHMSTNYKSSKHVDLGIFYTPRDVLFLLCMPIICDMYYVLFIHKNRIYLFLFLLICFMTIYVCFVQNFMIIIINRFMVAFKKYIYIEWIDETYCCFCYCRHLLMIFVEQQEILFSKIW